MLRSLGDWLVWAGGRVEIDPTHPHCRTFSRMVQESSMGHVYWPSHSLLTMPASSSIDHANIIVYSQEEAGFQGAKKKRKEVPVRGTMCGEVPRVQTLYLLFVFRWETRWQILIFFLFFFLLATLYGCWILAPRPGIEPRPLTVKAQSPNQWTIREIPQWEILMFRIPAVHSIYTEKVNPVFPSQFCTFVWGAVRGNISLKHSNNFHFVSTLELCTRNNEMSEEPWASHQFQVWMLCLKASQALQRPCMGRSNADEWPSALLNHTSGEHPNIRHAVSAV